MKDQQRNQFGQAASIFGICCNIFLASLKLVVGLMSGMISIVADSVNNFSDSASSIVSLVGFKLSSRPADEDHPFGHARYEYISGLVVAFLVMIAAVELLKESISEIIHPTANQYILPMYVVLIVSILVKLMMLIVYRIVGEKIHSSVMTAVSADSRNDVLATGAVLAGALISRYFHIDLDGYMGILVAAFVLVGGIGLIKETLDPLLGLTPDPEFVENIRQKILSYEGILGTHDLMVHDYGPGHVFVSVHVEVPAERGILEDHSLIDRIEREVSEDMKIKLLIHYDPIITEENKINPIYAFMKEQAAALGGDITIHDMRIVPGEDSTRVIFDVQVPKHFEMSDRDLTAALSTALADRFPGHHAQIGVDRGLVSMADR